MSCGRMAWGKRSWEHRGASKKWARTWGTRSYSVCTCGRWDYDDIPLWSCPGCGKKKGGNREPVRGGPKVSSPGQVADSSAERTEGACWRCRLYEDRCVPCPNVRVGCPQSVSKPSGGPRARRGWPNGAVQGGWRNRWSAGSRWPPQGQDRKGPEEPSPAGSALSRCLMQVLDEPNQVLVLVAVESPGSSSLKRRGPCFAQSV